VKALAFCSRNLLLLPGDLNEVAYRDCGNGFCGKVSGKPVELVGGTASGVNPGWVAGGWSRIWIGICCGVCCGIGVGGVEIGTGSALGPPNSVPGMLEGRLGLAGVRVGCGELVSPGLAAVLGVVSPGSLVLPASPRKKVGSSSQAAVSRGTNCLRAVLVLRSSLTAAVSPIKAACTLERAWHMSCRDLMYDHCDVPGRIRVVV
jgi:hypothetical protein